MGTSRSRFVEVTSKFVDKDINNQELYDKERDRLELLHIEETSKLQSQLYELKDQLNDKDKNLKEKSRQLQEEQQKNIALLFCDLPLQILQSSDYSRSSRHYKTVTIAQCNVVGFDTTLSCSIEPHEVVLLIDKIQAIIDEAFKDDNIFIMERYSDGCIAASGLLQQQQDTICTTVEHSSSSISKTPTTPQGNKRTISIDAIHANILANGVLKLMSLSSGIKVDEKQLQLRVAIHSGSCSAGVVSLQTAIGTQHIPHYKLFGPAVDLTKKLCSTGLALQVRVSKSCWELLNENGGYEFERCPDFMTWNGQQPIESYWLLGHSELDYILPSIDNAIGLSDYEDSINY